MKILTKSLISLGTLSTITGGAIYLTSFKREHNNKDKVKKPKTFSEVTEETYEGFWAERSEALRQELIKLEEAKSENINELLKNMFGSHSVVFAINAEKNWSEPSDTQRKPALSDFCNNDSKKQEINKADLVKKICEST